ncbi:MAG: 50S ribosomal protein L4 [Chloroflexi bacterium]|nr:50S ribosomal protein L4 [Chloroflexota bacterium]MDA1269884.1 50S ribosomal protein L4 [Chloroflexota bacterium]PKB59481.1 MAG: 50S ribosomal protein L4 [SAR202 cluster bacterium Casp-Chloro-G2]
MQVAVKNQSGDTLDNIELNDAVFNVPMNQSLVHQAMVIYQGNKRQGTHDTKTRAQVSGGGRKPWLQKHTGRARQGSTRAPQWRHGGVVFGPHPRSYRAALPKRMKRQALRCVLSDKARQSRLFCLDSTSTIDGKTKSMAQLLENLAVGGSALVVTMGTVTEVVQSAHNLKKIWTIPVNQLNAQELLARDTVIMTVEAARWAEETLAVEPHGRRGARWASGGTAEPEAADDEAVSVTEDTATAVAEEETKPRPRRRSATPAAAAGTADPTEAPAEEEAPKPRTRRRRATAAAGEEAAPETASQDAPTGDSSEEQA